MTRRSRRANTQRSRGQALVEFALVLPLALLLVFGLIDLGRVIYAQNALAEGARETARYGSVQARAATDIPGIEAYGEARITAVSGVAITASCVTLSALGCSPNDFLTVTAEADVSMVTPLIAQIMDGLGLNPIHLSSTSQVLVNN